MAPDFLKAGRPNDLSLGSDQRIFRLLEALPGLAVWLTFTLAIIGSVLAPAVVGIAAIIYDSYWFIKIIYFSFYLRTTYVKLRAHLKTDWLAKLKALSPASWQAAHPGLRAWSDVWQVVVIPMYKESETIVRESLTALNQTTYPKEKIIVALGYEERAGAEAAARAARQMQKEFGSTFGAFLIIEHPTNLPGEITGKASNETWAARAVKREIIDARKIPHEHILYTSLDVDSRLEPHYFALLTYTFLTHPRPFNVSYQPIAFFTNNIWQAPAIARVVSFSSTFWWMMQQERPAKQVTFSSHSMSFKTLVEVGFKQTNVVNDDSRIFWQCFFHFRGDYAVQSLYYPVHMDANVTPTFWRTVRNQYLQQRRWAAGAGDIPYCLFAYRRLNREFTDPFRRNALKRLFELMEGHFSWATTSLLVFFLGWLPTWLGGAAYNQTLFSYNLPNVVQTLATLASLALIFHAFLALRLLPPRPLEYGRHKYILMLLQWLLLPITMNALGAFPAIDAQTRLLLGKRLGFWPTEKFRQADLKFGPVSSKL